MIENWNIILVSNLMCFLVNFGLINVQGLGLDCNHWAVHLWAKSFLYSWLSFLFGILIVWVIWVAVLLLSLFSVLWYTNGGISQVRIVWSASNNRISLILEELQCQNYTITIELKELNSILESKLIYVDQIYE